MAEQLLSYRQYPGIYGLEDVVLFTEYGDWPVGDTIIPNVAHPALLLVNTVRYGTDNFTLD